MITVKVQRNRLHQITAFEVKGHARTAPYGEDIVCAAVSALTQTAVLGLQGCLGLNPLTEISNGFLRCTLPDGLDEVTMGKANLILETILVGLKAIAEAHPKNIRVKE